MNQALCTLETEKQHRWPEHLPELLQTFNTVHSATGFAPSYLMFGHHLRLPEDVGLGVMDVRPTCDLGSWVPDLSYTDELAHMKVRTVAEQTKQLYDCKEHATQLLIGEYILTHKGQWKLHGDWNTERQIIIETMGETGQLYKIKPERHRKGST